MRRALTMVSAILFVLTLFAYSGWTFVETPPADKAVFHQNGDCTSAYTLELGVGDYGSLPPPSSEYNLATWNDQISCMTIGSGISKVIVFEHTNFGGKRKEFSRASNNPLGSWSFAGGDWWNDKISSIKVIGPAPANNVVFFQDGDYNGNYMQLPRGEYGDLRNLDVSESGGRNWNDLISSMKIGAGITKVTVYWDVKSEPISGSGREFKRTNQNPDGCYSLTGDGWNDKISGIKIE